MIVYRIENANGVGMYAGEPTGCSIRAHLSMTGLTGGPLFPSPWYDKFFTTDGKPVDDWKKPFIDPRFGFSSQEQLNAWVGNFTDEDLSNLDHWAYLTKYDVPDAELICSERQVIFEGYILPTRISREKFSTQAHITRGT